MDNSKTAIIAMMVLSMLFGLLLAVSAGGYNVIWDNGMNYTGLLTSVNDTNSSYECLTADDFSFTEKQIVRDVHWIGGYVPPIDGNFNWEITFYNDSGTGNQPGTVIASFYFPNAETHETWIFTGGFIINNYSVDLPTPIEFEANTKYWVSIQGIGYIPPQSGWARHTSPILLHEAVLKSDDLGYPAWTSWSVFPPYGPRDVCFQLTGGKAEVPALTPIGLIALVSLLSAIAAVAIVRKRR
jgi:hypothetical protein